MSPTATAPRIKTIRHKDFARRMTQACDGHAHVPPPNFGRLQWFVDQLRDRFGADTTPETIRKWLAGETLPRPKSMAMLAEILEVDEAWLSLGAAPELDRKQQKLRNAEADGVVNVVAGFIQMSGGNPAYPSPDDKRAADSEIDLYAIIRGAQYAFHVVLAKDDLFAVPVAAENNFVVGVVRTGELSCEFYEIPVEVLSEGRRRGGHIEIVGTEGLRKITTFRERL